MSHSPARTLRLVACALLLGLSGCAKGMSFDWPGADVPVATRKHPADKVVAMWEPGQGPGINRLTTRGSIGTVMFFSDRRGGTPVRVRGSLRIYVFDDQGTAEDQAKPIHEFVLPPDTLDAHFQKTQLGGVYGLFVPYTRPGLQQTTCTIRLRFTPVDEKDQPLPSGGILSEMGTVTLPGTVDQKEEDKELVLQKSKMVQPAPPQTQESRAAALEEARKSVARLGKENAPPSALPLTDEERQRILSEAIARQESNPLTPVQPGEETHDWNEPPALHKGHPLDSGEELPDVAEPAVHPLEATPTDHPLDVAPKHPLSATGEAATPAASVAPAVSAVQVAANSSDKLTAKGDNPLRDTAETASPVERVKPPATASHPLNEVDVVHASVHRPATVPSPAPAVPAAPTASAPVAVAAAPAAPTFAPVVEVSSAQTSSGFWPRLQSLLLVVLSIAVFLKPLKAMVLKSLRS